MTDLQKAIEAVENVRKVGEQHDPLLVVFADAYLLQARKSLDYQAGVSRDAYFPLGLASFATMLNVKVQRIISLAQKSGATEFESVRDTALDLINYAAFLAEWLERQK